MMNTTTIDRIEKQILLRASRARVWRAISDPVEFAEWFGILALNGSFTPGARMTGTFDYKGKQLTGEFLVERVEPERLLSFRWHPYAVDPERDYSSEPMTLVEFKLEDVTGGTQLSVAESGFERIPLRRRAGAQAMNERGWEIQMGNVARYLGQKS
jgi:uncharacterized protein YndB with AHSA1/START domain